MRSRRRAWRTGSSAWALARRLALALAVWPWLAVFGGLAGCASGLPPALHPAASQALPLSPATPLGALAQASVAALATTAPMPEAAPMPDGLPAGLSGFRLLPLGSQALEARLALAAHARASIDLQTFHFATDGSGKLMLRALRDAAARGVRVRVLLDDLYTGGSDTVWRQFAAHAGVEVRLFNPFVTARSRGPLGRFAAAPQAWGRLNHRMHNKLFIADGAWAVFGGRNIADAYYLKAASDNFIDMDVVAAGALLPSAQASFDRYWNAGTAYPLAQVVGTEASPEAARAAFEAWSAPPMPGGDDAQHDVPQAGRAASAAMSTAMSAAMPAALSAANASAMATAVAAVAAMQASHPGLAATARDALGQPPLGAQLAGPRVPLWPGRARVLADDPAKPMQGSPGGVLMSSSVTHQVYTAMMQAQRQVLAASPYFIPGIEGRTLLAGLRARGVEVRVLTNSLASNDEVLAHFGYARHRQALLQAGVALHELSQPRLQRSMRMFLLGGSLGRLHAKALVVDARWTYLGSMNLDPRSATLNTEFGALIDSPALAHQVQALIETDIQQHAYAVRLAPDGGCCRWFAPQPPAGLQPAGEAAAARWLSHEPDTPLWLRSLCALIGPLVPEAHL